jgi:hypothetical protein
MVHKKSTGIYPVRFEALTVAIMKVAVRFQVLTAVSMMFRVVFWDILPCKMIVDRLIPDDGGSTHL